ncbi:glucose 1-dehydrogenase [Pseudactinotalea sp. HY160]|uniref:SDR family NAD(P)-dependent oxidoreductase n=1 Tax=Pseudactinotalea sp. HY160 TaxID=2654490 RepID=UPI00128E1E4C|nr:SDR family NAD(P)-dependent oxidoreductase [Pseudactinotalea sp. HY160]MPV48769.1 glucose 1-dehydrogenase [Pseudactinotalea sp. HY160]
MRIDLRGRVAVVTGAGRGIGRDVVTTLAGEGVRTVACDVTAGDLRSLGTDLASSCTENLQFECDVRDEAAVRETVRAAHGRLGRIDILINNAGVVDDATIEHLSESTWDLVQDVNVKGTFLMCKAVIPYMKAQRAGRIINAASFAAISPRVAGVAYASSKAAVAHLTRGLAGELGPWGITVNAYAPGMIPTAMNHFAELPEDQQQRLLETLTLRRWGTTGDIANLICFLASDRASYITGALIDVSGGKLATQIPAEAYDLAGDA